MPAASRTLRTFRYALYFNGNTYAVVPHRDVLNFQPGNKITVMARASITGIQAFYESALLIDKRSGDGGYRFEYGIGGMGMRVESAGVSPSIVVYFNMNRWNHFAIVLNGSWLGGYLNGALRSYRNDVPISSTITNTTNFYIARPPFSGYRMIGYIHSIHVYTRPLTDKEVSWNYNNPGNPVRDGLVLWLQADPQYVKDIDGDGILEWIDLSGFGNHGKIYGAKLVEVIKAPSRILTPARVIS